VWVRVLICAGIGRRSRGRGSGRGHGSRVTYRHGDFVELAESVPPADTVMLDRVISVYPDLDRLAGLSVERARRLFGLVYPRDTRIVRLVFFATSLILRLLRKPVRASSIRSTRSSGLFARTVSAPTSLDESDACGRLNIASLCVPPAR
jgi:hypothetical protein